MRNEVRIQAHMHFPLITKSPTNEYKITCFMKILHAKTIDNTDLLEGLLSKEQNWDENFDSLTLDQQVSN